MNDNIKEKKQWLYRYRNNQIKINRLQEKLYILDSRIISTKSPTVSDVPRGGNPVTIEDLLSDKLILIKRIEKLENKGAKYRSEIMETIDNLENFKHAEVLEHWFIKGYNAVDISKALGYSTAYIFKLYAKALKEIDIPIVSNENLKEIGVV